jgi:hypothetical protein
MPVLRCPHISPQFASGGWLTVAEWGSRPVNVPEAPTIPLAPGQKPGACLSLSPALGTPLAVAPRDGDSLAPMVNTCQAIGPERRGGASSLCLQAEVCAPHI